MRNQLLIGYDSDELFSVDCIEDLDISITKNIYTIEDPSKRLSDFTKTISIPGSKNNDNIFKSLFDVNFHIRDAQQLNPDFNPAKKATCLYLQDELTQISGYCQLTEIIVLENNKVTYEIVIYGNNADIFSKIGNYTLQDITGFGTFTWNDAAIKASWTTPTIGVGVYYPYLNRGMGFSWRGGAPLPNPAVDYNNFKPWVYVYGIFYLIFENIGIGASGIISNFLNSVTFARLIMEGDLSKFTLDQETKDDSQATAIRNVGMNVTMNYTDPPNVFDNQYWTFNTVVQDNYSQYSAGTITVADEGYHTLKGHYELQSTTATTPLIVSYSTYIILRRSGQSDKIIWSDYVTVAPGNTPVTVFNDFRIDSYYYEQGDEIRICSGWVGNSAGNFMTGEVMSFNPGGGALEFTFYKDSQIGYNTTYGVEKILPAMKQTDFIMAIVKMFNLYIQSNEDGTITIEPRDDFFLDETIDWTSKLDTSKDFKIKPQGLLNVKQLEFNYGKGETDRSQIYFQSKNMVHGSEKLIFTNDFVKDVKKVDIPFMIEPLTLNDDNSTMVLMATSYGGGNVERTNIPMIAFAGDLQTCAAPYRYYDEGAMTYTEYSTYAYAGHIDDLLNPTIDLCFRSPELYFYDFNGVVNSPTNGDLYSLYHYNQWQEIGDRDSKMVEAYFKLNANDINQLDFRKLYWVENAAYRLLEVQDHAPNGTSTTKCILLKVNLVDQLVQSVTTTFPDVEKTGGGGGGSHTGGQGGGDLIPMGVIRNGIFPAGPDNYVKNSTGVVILGSSNSIPNGFNVLISGNRNTLTPGLTNVNLIGCEDLNITTSGVTYINNKLLNIGTPTDGQVLTYDSGTDSMRFETPTGGGATVFTGLTDVPASYTGAALKVVRVNAGETDLEFATIGALTDGDKGDITVSGSGATWTIDAGAISLSKMSDLEANSIMGNDTGSPIAPKALTALETKTLLSLQNVVNVDTTTTANITDSSNKRFITDAQQTVLGNTSNTNSGDNAVNSNYSGLVSNATHTGDATGATALTVVKIQGKDFPTLGAGDDQKYPKYDNGTNAFVMTTIAGGGDMVLASVQTVSGAKTFNDTKLLMRNVANTFNGSFTNTNSADRVYTLPDATDTVVLLGVAQTLTSKTLTTPIITNTVANTVGSVERNANVFVGTPVSGASGVIPTTMFAIVESGGFNLQVAAGVQSAFPATKDVWTLAASTTYYVEGMYYISKATTALTTAIAFALGGGASITSMRLEVISTHLAANTTGTANNSTIVDRVASTVVTASSAANAMISFKGLIRMNAAGTVTPQINWSTGATATPNMNADSYIRFTPLGTNTTNSIGNVA